jgi:hypothetical protein
VFLVENGVVLVVSWMSLVRLVDGSVLGMSGGLLSMVVECSGLGAVWIGVTCFLTSVSVLYGLEHGGDWKAGLCFGLVTIALFGSGDVSVLCLLFELLNLPLLSMLWFRSVSGVKGVLYATYLLVVYGLVSGMLLIVGVGFGIGGCLGAAAGVKLALAPLHVWLGKVHVECSTLGSVLLAGVALKVGYYVGLLFAGEITSYVSASTFFFLVGMGLVQLGLLDSVDTKRLVALFSVAHMQVLVIFLGGTGFASLVTTWVTIGMVAHSLVSSGLFFLVGRLVECFGSRNLSELAVFTSSLPFLWWFLLGSNCALPLSSLFLVEILGHASLLSFGSLGVVLLLLAFASLSFVACVLVLHRLVVGLPSFPGPVFGTISSFVGTVCSLSSWLIWVLCFPLVFAWVLGTRGWKGCERGSSYAVAGSESVVVVDGVGIDQWPLELGYVNVEAGHGDRSVGLGRWNEYRTSLRCSVWNGVVGVALSFRYRLSRRSEWVRLDGLGSVGSASRALGDAGSLVAFLSFRLGRIWAGRVGGRWLLSFCT